MTETLMNALPNRAGASMDNVAGMRIEKVGNEDASHAMLEPRDVRRPASVGHRQSRHSPLSYGDKRRT